MAKGFTHESTYNESKEWYTPRYIFNALDLYFDLDPCSPGKNIVPWVPARKHLTYLDSGLTAHWEGRVWLNPPYGMDTPKWFRHLAMVGNGIGLVFARTDTKWFHEFVPMADAICFIKGRVQFVAANQAEDYARGLAKPQGGCGAASMLVAFGEDNAKALFCSGLGLALPVSRPIVDGRVGERFAGDKLATPSNDNENLPHSVEPGKALLF